MENEAQEIERGQTISISRFFLNRRHYHYAFYHFSISPSPVLVSALRFSNSRRRTLEILSRRRRSIGRKEPEIVTQMNLKYCHFTFPPVSLSLSPLLLSDFPLSYLSFRHRSSTTTIFSINDHPPNLSLSLKHASSPLHRHLFLVPFLFIKSPIFAPTNQSRCIPFSPISLSFSPIISPPPPNVSPTFSSLVFAASYRCAASPPSRCTPSCRLYPPHDRCTWPHLQVSATERNRWRRQIEWKSEIAIRKGRK